MKEKEKNPVIETADQTITSYEQAVQAGLKFQEETWRSWCALLEQSTFGPEWQKRFNGMGVAGDSIMPTAQKRLEETASLMEKNARSSADLMKKAVDASLTPAIAESQSKWIEFAKDWLKAAQANVEGVMQINSRTVDSFFDFVRKNSDLTAQASAGAKAAA